MPEKNFAIDYFQLSFRSDDASERFTNALREPENLVDGLVSIGAADKRIRFARIDEARQGDSVWTGDVEALDMILTRHKSRLDAKGNEAITLDSHEKISEQVAFLYYAPLKVLVMQHSREGVTVKRFCELCGSIIKRSIGYTPIIKPEALERVRQLDTVTKLRIAYAGSKPPQDFEHAEPSRLFSVGYDFNAKRTEVVLSIGQGPRSKSLNKKPFKEIVARLFGQGGEEGIELLKFIVEGRHDEADGEDGTYTEIIDILRDRLKDRAYVTVSDIGTLPYELRVGELRRSFERYREALHRILE